LISLDGNEDNNRYRVYKNGNAAFSRVMYNIKRLRDKHPGYFQEKVNFNAVLHNLNSVSDIYHFFKKTFNKYPNISSLNTSGIAVDQEEAFWKTYSNIAESLFQNEDYPSIENDMFITLPNIRNLSLFIHRNNDFTFEDYKELLTPPENRLRYITGTCMPFSKKIFVTVTGRILPCERIGHQHSLGYVSEKDGLVVDFQAAAEKYTHYFESLENQCVGCGNLRNCTKCIFNMDIKEERIQCKNFLTKGQYTAYLSKCLDVIEDKPALYAKVLKEVIVE
jgi:uncharacterized protein